MPLLQITYLRVWVNKFPNSVSVLDGHCITFKAVSRQRELRRTLRNGRSSFSTPCLLSASVAKGSWDGSFTDCTAAPIAAYSAPKSAFLVRSVVVQRTGLVGIVFADRCSQLNCPRGKRHSIVDRSHIRSDGFQFCQDDLLKPVSFSYSPSRSLYFVGRRMPL